MGFILHFKPLHNQPSMPWDLPRQQTEGSAGFDVRAYTPNHDIVLASGERRLVPLGFAMALTSGYEAQIRPRSGLAYKHGVTVLNSPGTIDSDYRGEVKVLLINHHCTDPFTVRHGDRVAQMVIAKLAVPHEILTVDTLDSTDRGSGGFGSTGK